MITFYIQCILFTLNKLLGRTEEIKKYLEVKHLNQTQCNILFKFQSFQS